MLNKTYEELEQIIAEAQGRLGTPFAVWKHKNTGGAYVFEKVALDEKTLEPVVVYRPLAHPLLPFVRPVESFLARFVPAPEES